MVLMFGDFAGSHSIKRRQTLASKREGRIMLVTPSLEAAGMSCKEKRFRCIGGLDFVQNFVRFPLTCFSFSVPLFQMRIVDHLKA